LFAGPIFNGSGATVQSDDPEHAQSKSIPFKLAKEDKPLLLLETMVDGKGPFRFVLDTGAGGTIVSPELAKKLNITPIEPKKQRKAIGAGGQVGVRMGQVRSFQVAEVRREGLHVAIMDLAGISQAVETELDGIIGYNFLKQYRVTIDYPNRTVSFE
jgi:predicted aspartyl protease